MDGSKAEYGKYNHECKEHKDGEDEVYPLDPVFQTNRLNHNCESEENIDLHG